MDDKPEKSAQNDQKTTSKTADQPTSDENDQGSSGQANALKNVTTKWSEFRARFEGHSITQPDQANTSLTAFLRTMALERIIPNTRRFWNERQLLVWLLAIILGVAVAYSAIGFRAAISAVQYIWLQDGSENVFRAASQVPWLLILLAPAVGGLFVGWFLTNFMPSRRAHGVADVIEARAIRGCRIDLKTGLGSALVSAVSLGAGASAGREGPMVHLGATIASKLEDYFQLPRATRRTLLACGVATAVSASFNAPIAGVLFAHEIILGHYALSAFVPIVISSVIGSLIARLHIGEFPAFIIPHYQLTSYWEFPAFALLGITCALVAILFLFGLMIAERISSSIEMPLWARPAVGGLAVGAIAVFFPQVLGVGYDATDTALKQELPLTLLLSLIVAKCVATAITLSSRFGGGIFSPSLYLGAMTGAAFGLIAASAFPDVASSNGLYALLGMGAVAAATIGAPISTVLIVFELTGGYGMTIALLLCVSIATGLTQAIHGQSFFNWQLARRGLFFQEGPHQEIRHRLTVSEFMRPVGEDETVDDIDPEGDTPWLTKADTVESALRAFSEAGHSTIAVVDDRRPTRVIGWADHISALDAYNAALIESHREEHV